MEHLSVTGATVVRNSERLGTPVGGSCELVRVSWDRELSYEPSGRARIRS